MHVITTAQFSDKTVYTASLFGAKTSKVSEFKCRCKRVDSESFLTVLNGGQKGQVPSRNWPYALLGLGTPL